MFALVEALEQRCKQVGEAFRVKDEAISVAEQIRDTSKNYLKQKDEEIESLRLEVVSNCYSCYTIGGIQCTIYISQESLRKKLKKQHSKEPEDLLS